MTFVGLARRLGTIPLLRRHDRFGRLIRPFYHRGLSATSERGGIARTCNGQTFRWRYPFSQFDADYEAPVVAAFHELVEPGMTVFDIGANFGLFTLPAARAVGDAGRVYAFEPVPATAEVLADHLRLNRLGDRVELVPCAVSESSGEIELWERGTSPLASVSRHAAERSPAVPGAGNTERRVVPTVSLDDFCGARGVSPDIIKLDVEGAEARVLRGACRLLSRRACLILLEAHPGVLTQLGDSHYALLATLTSAGWSCDFLYRRGDETNPNATFHYLCRPSSMPRPRSTGSTQTAGLDAPARR